MSTPDPHALADAARLWLALPAWRDLSPAAKVLLMAAVALRDDQDRVLATVTHLATQAGLTPAKAARALEQLVALGWLRDGQQAGYVVRVVPPPPPPPEVPAHPTRASACPVAPGPPAADLDAYWEAWRAAAEATGTALRLGVSPRDFAHLERIAHAYDLDTWRQAAACWWRSPFTGGRNLGLCVSQLDELVAHVRSGQRHRFRERVAEDHDRRRAELEAWVQAHDGEGLRAEQ